MPSSVDKRSVNLLVVKYWDEGKAVHRALHDKNDQAVSLSALIEQLIDELDPDDGVGIVLTILETGRMALPGGELRMRKVLDGSFVREKEEEVEEAELLLRRASRRLGRRVEQPLVLDLSIRTLEEVPADWDKRIVILWEEDEVLLRDPTAEHLHGAILRICGCEREGLGPVLAKVDHGDAGYDLYRDGWVRGWSYCGDSVGRLVTEEVGR